MKHLFVISRLKGGEIHRALAFLRKPKTQTNQTSRENGGRRTLSSPAVGKSGRISKLDSLGETPIKFTLNCLPPRFTRKNKKDTEGKGRAGKDRRRESQI